MFTTLMRCASVGDASLIEKENKPVINYFEEIPVKKIIGVEFMDGTVDLLIDTDNDEVEDMRYRLINADPIDYGDSLYYPATPAALYMDLNKDGKYGPGERFPIALPPRKTIKNLEGIKNLIVYKK